MSPTAPNIGSNALVTTDESGGQMNWGDKKGIHNGPKPYPHHDRLKRRAKAQSACACQRKRQLDFYR